MKIKIKQRKLKMASLHVNSCSEDSISTGVRLCRFCSEYFDIPFIHNKQTAQMYMDEYDILFVKFGILLFCNYRDELFEIYKKAKRIISLEEDYTMGPDYRLTKLNPSLEIWSNMPYRAKETGGHYINWNRMTWKHGLSRQPPTLKGLGYYGAYRPDREVYFKKYMKDAPYKVHVSSFKRNHLKWRDLDSKIHIIGEFSYRRQICAFQTILYVEDVFTHSHYNSPANRFYECLCNGVPLLIDESCRNTFKMAGYVIDPFIVRSQKDAQRMIGCSNEIAALQREQWYRNYYEELCDDFTELVRKSIGGRYAIQGHYPIV